MDGEQPVQQCRLNVISFPNAGCNIHHEIELSAHDHAQSSVVALRDNNIDDISVSSANHYRVPTRPLECSKRSNQLLQVKYLPDRYVVV